MFLHIKSKVINWAPRDSLLFISPPASTWASTTSPNKQQLTLEVGTSVCISLENSGDNWETLFCDARLVWKAQVAQWKENCCRYGNAFWSCPCQWRVWLTYTTSTHLVLNAGQIFRKSWWCKLFTQHYLITITKNFYILYISISILTFPARIKVVFFLALYYLQSMPHLGEKCWCLSLLHEHVCLHGKRSHITNL